MTVKPPSKPPARRKKPEPPMAFREPGIDVAGKPKAKFVKESKPTKRRGR